MEKAQKPEISLLIKKKHLGAGLIEIMLVLAVVAFLVTNLLKSVRTPPKVSVKNALEEINEVFQKAFMSSITGRSIVQVRFYFDEMSHLIKLAYGVVKDKDDAAHNVKDLTERIVKNNVYVKKLIINNKNEMDSRTRETWILIFPQGYSQPCTLEISNDEENISNEYYLNPLQCRFKLD